MTVFIQLTRGFQAILDDEDAELAQLKWHAFDGKHTMYARRVLTRTKTRGPICFLLHREVARRMGLDIEGLLVDHRNGDGLDCRRHNIRVATNGQNMWNRGRTKKNRSGFKGVSWDSVNQKWRANIKYGGKVKNLGRFVTPEEAHEAYCRAAEKFHGEFANTGTPKETP